MPPELAIQDVPAVLFEAKRHRELGIFIWQSIVLPQIAFLVKHYPLPVVDQPIGQLLPEVACWIIGKSLFGGQLHPQSLLNTHIHAVACSTDLQHAKWESVQATIQVTTTLQWM